MRIRFALVIVLSLVVAAPARAQEPPEPPDPIDVTQGRAVGRAAATNGLNGIYVSPYDGKVYVASVGGDEITVHDPDTGELLDRIGPERGVHGPDDLFIAEDGTMYWTEILTGNVGVRRPDGSVDYEFVGPGVNPITMSDDGRLFVGRIFLGQGLYELDPDFDGDPTLLNEDLILNAFDFGPDGYLYAPSFFTGEILKIDVDAAVPVVGEVVADGFRALSSVKFNSLGEMHTVDIANGQVWKVDVVGGHHEVVIEIEGTIDNMAFGTDDRLYAAAGADNQIIRFDGRRVKALSPAGLGLPGGVAVSPDGTLWVSELFAMRGISPNRRMWTSSFYDRIDPPGTAFAGSTSVAADGDNLILSSGFANSVQVMDPATGTISLDIRNLLIVTNAIRHGTTLVATQLGLGNVVNAEDPNEVLIDGLAVPLGLASDGDTLYVGDWALGNVWAVSDAGISLLATGLALPEGLAVDGDQLLVVETGLKQVTAIDLATGQTSPVIVGLDYSDRVPEGFFPYGNYAGVAVGADRSIYVSDDGVNTVYQFRRSRR